MDNLFTQLSWLHVVAVVGAGFLSVAFYRLLLHPLSRFPGPKLAAVTRYYEGYYDVYRNGQYTFKIAELHKQYGPIIRISPYELHVNDPTFYDTLYRQDAHYDKYAWSMDAFGALGATVFTAKHEVHKARRQPLSPFFSKSRVAKQQDLIFRHLDRLFQRLAEYVETGETFDLGAATTAFVRDVTNDFVLGKSYASLDRRDFDVAQIANNQASGAVWRLTKFLRFVAPTIKAVPPSLLLKISKGHMKEFMLFLQELREDTQRLMAAATSGDTSYSGKRTIVHEIMDSKLPPSEKTWRRIMDDTSTVTGAGFETTASILRLLTFHIFSNEQFLQRLRAELASAGATSESPLEWKDLEQLPYLTAIIHEGLRLNPALATRLARIAPSDGFTYKQWHIPAGTPVGMTTILMHTDEALFPDPQKFNPDRWIEADGTFKRNQAGFAPFSKGTRICLGMQLAWAEIYILLSSLAQNFDFHFPSATVEDFEISSDQFSIGTKGMGRLDAIVSQH